MQKGGIIMSELVILNAEGKPYHKQIVDKTGSRITEFDKDGNEVIVSECNK